jgi:asparagine synthase (glutamine-hydrolysing)
LSSILETLPSRHPSTGTRYEYRYPYLDRDLVDFLFRVPREQIVRPGRRRSLMRRALKELLPAEVLERRRKAYISRGPLIALREADKKVDATLTNPLIAELGFVDATALRCCFETVLRGEETDQWPYLLKVVVLEQWLQSGPHGLEAMEESLPKTPRIARSLRTAKFRPDRTARRSI